MYVTYMIMKFDKLLNTIGYNYKILNI